MYQNTTLAGASFASIQLPIIPPDDPKTFWPLAAVLVLAIYILYNRPLKGARGSRIPKGPRGLPILGCFLSLTKFPELTLDKWAHKYGGLYSIWIGSQLFVIISDPKVAKDLMVTNGTVFSSRRETYIKGQTVFGFRGVVSNPYNDRWRKHRRLANNWLIPRAVSTYAPMMERKSRALIKDMLDEGQQGLVPVSPQPHASCCAFSVMAEITFGARFEGIDHPIVKRGAELNKEFVNCTGPVSNLVDFIPVLQAFPSAMQRRAKRLHCGLVETYGGLLTEIDQKLQQGVDVPRCLARSLVECREKEDLDDLDAAMLVSAFMIGGVETTAAIMQWFFAIIPAYPEIQKKAQAELDRVVGRGRLPTNDDEKNLPYCRAIIKEVGRFRSPLWLSTPHSTSENFVYGDHFIPKDTVVVLNTWTMQRDPMRHPNPYEFDPERYINDPLSSSESAKTPDPMQRDHWVFGIGRRVCPGIMVAERGLFLVISRVLWAFDMREIPGEPIDLKEYEGLSGRSPKPFRIQLVPRHEGVVRVVGGDS
ncbi:hypothetical protein ASPVEDRAFT_55955 [Aspergillus versicolor CBS 583.65]|uniref:Cytochrome P450 n=1 Tax=Aspergillus versicolor CBS 583.65 TaxID=1036611 RepID=A0A1L9PXM9_ASPVE|nr:uncharacterized protein ASPVEDRAFT_55955 [Aspergillus versicolor CBS 583.65]OJJ06278.1 hypothetical protein ASPVEDRAFT_55955 [Aspergillus versicolor CBS 583.65]